MCFAIDFYTWPDLNSLKEGDVGDDLCVDMLVESPHESLSAHHEVLLQDGGVNLHIECLVLDEDVARVAQDSLPHHLTPRIDETMLVEGCFQSFFS